MLYIVLLYHTIFYYSVFYYNSLNTAIIYSITIHLQLFTYIPLYLYIYIYYSGLIISITGWFFLEEELVLSPAPWPSWSCCRTEENTSHKSSCFTGTRSAGEIPFWMKKRGPLSGEKNFGAKIRRGKSQEELRFCGYEWLGNGTQVPQKHADWWGIGINLGFYEPYGDVTITGATNLGFHEKLITKTRLGFLAVSTGWCPPSISWFKNHTNIH